jgi:hypothetical protein
MIAIGCKIELDIAGARLNKSLCRPIPVLTAAISAIVISFLFMLPQRFHNPQLRIMKYVSCAIEAHMAFGVCLMSWICVEDAGPSMAGKNQAQFPQSGVRSP